MLGLSQFSTSDLIFYRNKVKPLNAKILIYQLQSKILILQLSLHRNKEKEIETNYRKN